MRKQFQRVNDYISAVLLLLLLLIIAPAADAKATTASRVSLGVINYEELTIQVFNHNNSIVYYSTDNENWTEVEGSYVSGAYLMDISWISSSNDVTLSFKGDLHTGIASVTIPKQNNDFNVSFDKVEGEFIFDHTDLSEIFEWRKASDYHWSTVSLDESTASYQAFLETVESFRVKGAKLILRLPQEVGSAKDPGSRPSKEITLTIPTRADAPKVSVNSSKLTLNTTTAMEYYEEATGIWIECTKGMTLEEIAPGVLHQNGARNVTLKLRTAATEKAPYSKTALLTIPGQQAAPRIGGNTEDVSYYYVNSKLTMVFNLASITNSYEYTIIKPGMEFDPMKAKWTTVSLAKPMTLTNATAPDGSTVYVRKKGTDENSSKNISLMLSSAITSFDVNIRRP